MSLSALEEKHW